nr:hypothetical protein [Sedimentibacter sp.]
MEEGLKEIYEKINDAVLETFKTNNNFFDYMDMAASIHDMSYENVLLIQLQNKNAVHIESKNMWLQKERIINAEEKALLIVYPKIIGTRIDGKYNLKQSYEFKNVYDISQTSGKDIIRNYSMNEENILFAEKMIKNKINNTFFQNRTETQVIEYIVSKKFNIDVDMDKFINISAWSSNKTVDDLKRFLESVQYGARNIINLIDETLIERNKLIITDKRKTLNDLKNGVELYKRQDKTINDSFKQNKIEER